MKINVIITGSTGMVGEGVLHECLNHPDIDKVLVINRRSVGINHPALTELIVSDFFDLSSIEDKLSGYHACFYCLGVTSLGLKEPEYYHVTYDLTMDVARRLESLNPDMVFCYISGAGTTRP
jgi:nucleoside-diphosphate-sugar epimerase